MSQWDLFFFFLLIIFLYFKTEEAYSSISSSKANFCSCTKTSILSKKKPVNFYYESDRSIFCVFT